MRLYSEEGIPRNRVLLVLDMLKKVEASFALTCLATCLVFECCRMAPQDPPAGRCAPKPESYSIENRASCTFIRVLDIDSRRIPPEVAAVRCKCPGSACSERGDFRCQEVKERVKVSYPRNDDCGPRSSAFVNETLEVTTACICALSRTLSAADDELQRTSFAGPNATSLKRS
ncbi:hypothetical protein HPB50_023472 [Hyalomma asiaticum]|uniref:Uncharacterized protein n=1 Tax=Hyalomma asiaticum TaxID=266040 RepID=A0ACB7RKZ9_HYAAI|nr:hypothetical protein HPB50_023472 [Hyalomma asiaticum]